MKDILIFLFSMISSEQFLFTFTFGPAIYSIFCFIKFLSFHVFYDISSNNQSIQRCQANLNFEWWGKMIEFPPHCTKQFIFWPRLKVSGRKNQLFCKQLIQCCLPYTILQAADTMLPPLCHLQWSTVYIIITSFSITCVQ